MLHLCWKLQSLYQLGAPLSLSPTRHRPLYLQTSALSAAGAASRRNRRCQTEPPTGPSLGPGPTKPGHPGLDFWEAWPGPAWSGIAPKPGPARPCLNVQASAQARPSRLDLIFRFLGYGGCMVEFVLGSKSKVTINTFLFRWIFSKIPTL